MELKQHTRYTLISLLSYTNTLQPKSLVVRNRWTKVCGKDAEACSTRKACLATFCCCSRARTRENVWKLHDVKFHLHVRASSIIIYNICCLERLTWNNRIKNLQGFQFHAKQLSGTWRWYMHFICWRFITAGVSFSIVALMPRYIFIHIDIETFMSNAFELCFYSIQLLRYLRLVPCCRCVCVCDNRRNVEDKWFALLYSACAHSIRPTFWLRMIRKHFRKSLIRHHRSHLAEVAHICLRSIYQPIFEHQMGLD